MVAPLILGSAALSIGQGLLGLLGSKEESDAARREERATTEAARLSAETNRQAIGVELKAAIEAGRLELAAAGLDVKATGYDLQGIALKTGSNIFNALVSGEIDAINYEARAEAAEFNANVAEQVGRSEKSASYAEAGDFSRIQGARLASNRAERAASGIVSTEGSPLLIDDAIFSEIEIGTARIEHQGDVAFFKGLTEARLLRHEAANDRLSAKIARRTSKIEADYSRQAGEIERKGALLGLDTADLRRRAAESTIETAHRTADINRRTVGNTLTSTTKAASISSKSRQKSATLSGVSSFLGGAMQATETLATKGKFG